MRVCTFGCTSAQAADVESHFAPAPVFHIDGEEAGAWARSVGVVLPVVSVEEGMGSMWLSLDAALAHESGRAREVEVDKRPEVTAPAPVGATPTSHTPEAKIGPVSIGEQAGLKTRQDAIEHMDACKAELLSGGQRTHREHVRQTELRSEGERHERI